MKLNELANPLKIFPGKKTIVLAGNPNVGKSVFFNALTNRYVDVSNFPGTTVDVSHSALGEDILLDTPGIYGVSSFNDEERVARDVILQADVVINIVDALHLERDLFLTQQLIDMQIPLVIALNMIDEAKQHGVRVNCQALSRKLGVPVIPTIAVKGEGIAEVKAAVASKAALGNQLSQVAMLLAPLRQRFSSTAEALLYLEADPKVKLFSTGKQVKQRQEEIYLLRRRHVNEIVAAVVRESTDGAAFAVRLGQMMLRPAAGLPVLLLSLAALYYFIGVFVAQVVVGFTEGVVMKGYYAPLMEILVGRFFAPGSVTAYVLIGEYGLLTMTVVYLLGLLMPLVAAFYFSLSLMEDSGYLPRVATLLDRLLVKIGLNGRAVIPIILGFGCVTMATITTRLLGSKRERIIATALLGIGIPCSAQLGVIFGMIAPLGPAYLAIYLVTVGMVFATLGIIMDKVLPGRSTDLLVDLPLLRMPQLGNVLRKTYSRTLHFIKEALPLFAVGALLISLLNTYGLLLKLQKSLHPLVSGWLSLPPEATTAFIMGIVRRDFGAAGLYALPMTAGQTMVSLVAITLFVPCIASLLVIFKERGLKDGLLIWLGSFVTAFLVGGLLARIML